MSSFQKARPHFEDGLLIIKLLLLLDVSIIEGVTALRAELGRICGILGFEAALVALVKRCACGSLSSASAAEITLVYGSA